MPRTWILAVFGLVMMLRLGRAAEPDLVGGLKPFLESGTLAGAVVAVAGPDGLLACEAIGQADINSHVSMRPDHLFWIASMNKPITAAAFMMLVDEGKVQLDDPVEKYLPEFRNQMVLVERVEGLTILKRPTHPVLIRNLLSHTAGLVGQSPLEHHFDELPLSTATITYGLSPLKFDPGTKYEYCNPGINTVGRLIEVLGGVPYETFLQQRLLDPLGMNATTFWPTAAPPGRVATSYKLDDSGKNLSPIPIEQLTYPLENRRRAPYPAGGLFSTAEDVARFGRMILNGGLCDGRRYLSEAAIRELTGTQTGNLLNDGRGESGYGLGFSTTRRSRGASGPAVAGSCGHGGAYMTHFEVDPEHRLVTVFLIQQAGKAAGDYREPFAQAVRRAYPSR